ncbi:MAG: leucine-rich repeat domain-containing protein, partial [Ruminococcus sp.]|nr:leucine-rich repeat domain-containing protein [Ruminococcus sp.]
SVKKGNYSFFNCTSLKTVHFDEGYTTFVTGMFRNTGIESITIPEGVTELPGELFKDCQKLTTVELPSTLRTIGYNAFDSCPVLDNVDIPESVKRIDSGAFAGTTSLKTFTLHEGIQTMNYGIFRDSALTSVYIPKTLSTTDSPFAESHITDVTFADGIAMLTDNLFRGDGYLTEIEIPDTVIRIGSACFRNTNLEAVIIPDSVKTLGTSLFEECDNLCAVKIGAGVRKLPQYCFYGCDMLQNVVIPETVNEMDTSVFERSGLYYQKLPQSITAIGSWAFKDCANLVKVECSDNLETIGDYAFERCASFTTLQTAAKEVPFNNTTFKDCPQFIDPRFYVFNPAKTGIESTGNIGANHTLVHFTVRYDIRDDWKDEDLVMQKLWLNYPDSFDIVTTSFAAEGFDFDNASYTGDYKSFSLTGGKSSGELRFSAYVNSADAAARDFSAEVEFTHKGTGFRKPIGKVSFTTAKLSIFAPSSVTTPAITVSGYSAVSGSNVNITISRINADGSTDCTVTYPVTPNKYTGKYTAEALRIVPEDKTAVNGDTFEVIATCGGNRSDTVRFEYTP